MHVPTCESSLLDIVSFDDALASSGGRGDYDAEKWLYVPDYYTDYRYILGTRGSDPLICIGINPSTAAPDDLDNTLKSVSRIAAGNGSLQLGASGGIVPLINGLYVDLVLRSVKLVYDLLNQLAGRTSHGVPEFDGHRSFRSFPLRACPLRLITAAGTACKQRHRHSHGQ